MYIHPIINGKNIPEAFSVVTVPAKRRKTQLIFPFLSNEQPTIFEDGFRF
jgi:hypothetical protein